MINIPSAAGKAHVACLDLLDDLVLVTGIVQTHLVLEIEGRLGVVVRADLELIPDVPLQIQLDPLVRSRMLSPTIGWIGIRGFSVLLILTQKIASHRPAV